MRLRLANVESILVVARKLEVCFNASSPFVLDARTYFP